MANDRKRVKKSVDKKENAEYNKNVAKDIVNNKEIKENEMNKNVEAKEVTIEERRASIQQKKIEVAQGYLEAIKYQKNIKEKNENYKDTENYGGISYRITDAVFTSDKYKHRVNKETGFIICEDDVIAITKYMEDNGLDNKEGYNKDTYDMLMALATEDDTVLKEIEASNKAKAKKNYKELYNKEKEAHKNTKKELTKSEELYSETNNKLDELKKNQQEIINKAVAQAVAVAMAQQNGETK